MTTADAAVQRYLDPTGKLRQWPAKRQARDAVMTWLLAHFDRGRRYTEAEVNDILTGAHTFGDPAMLRRALFDHHRLERTADGSAYWRA